MSHLFKILVISLSSVFLLNQTASAQLKYQSGRCIMGADSPYLYYSMTVAGNGIYFNHTNNRFFQIDVSTAGAPRIAGHNNEVVFYNSQSKTYNSIQVKNVYNYSDAKAKTGIRTLTQGLEIVGRLHPVTYNFAGGESNDVNNTVMSRTNKYMGGNTEIGLLAQEVEAVLPNVVFTDEEGKKLINYTALIPVLIDAIQALREEVDMLKEKVNN